MWREKIIFADTHTIKQTHTNSKTEAHSYPLSIVGERANSGINSDEAELSGRETCEILSKSVWNVFIHRHLIYQQTENFK